MTPVEEFELTIPCDIAEGQAVAERIVKPLEDLVYSPRDIFAVRLALEEALANAMKHGNRMDPNKRVHICCRIDPAQVWIEIADDGDGFRLDEVPDPTSEENLERPCGRGIMLMRSFMSSVEYNDVGNRVVLVKHRNSNCEKAGP